MRNFANAECVNLFVLQILSDDISVLDITICMINQVVRMSYVRIGFARLYYKLLNMIKIQNDSPRN